MTTKEAQDLVTNCVKIEDKDHFRVFGLCKCGALANVEGASLEDEAFCYGRNSTQAVLRKKETFQLMSRPKRPKDKFQAWLD